jgi:hypothetical protein
VIKTIQVAHVINNIGQMADDFMLAILLMKATDKTTKTLPFLHAHALELSAKCAILQIDQAIPSDKLTHRIREAYKKITQHRLDFADLLPKDDSYTNYRKVWIRDVIPDQNIELPNPELLDEYEVCFFIENIVDLKYGFNKQMQLVSPVEISRANINSKFWKLFAGTRQIYSTNDLNERVISRGISMFGSNSAAKTNLMTYFGVAV